MAIARQDVRPTLQTALEAAAFFSAKAVKAVLHDGSRAALDAQESELRDEGKPGVVLAIPPLAMAVKRGGNAAARLGERAVSFVRLRVNPERNGGGAAGAAGFDFEAAIDAVKRVFLALHRAGTVPDLEVGQPEPEGLTDALADDPGLLASDIWFNVPLFLRPE